MAEDLEQISPEVSAVYGSHGSDSFSHCFHE